MRVLHLFAGAGGSHLAGELLGWKSVGSVEIEPYCQAVIKYHYPNEVIHGDICTFTAHHLRGRADGICGGFPCQDISSAGKGAGITGERSGLWKEFARIIGECRPKWVFIENSPLLRTRGLEVVLEDLASLGYDAEWSTFRASDVGAPHRRDRMWILAYTKQDAGDQRSQFPMQRGWKADTEQTWVGRSEGSLAYTPEMLRDSCGTYGCEVPESGDGSVSSVADTDETLGQRIRQQPCGVQPTLADAYGTSRWWAKDPADLPKSSLGRVVNGLADPLLRWNRVHALAALGNGWVPLQAAEAFRQLWGRTR